MWIKHAEKAWLCPACSVKSEVGTNLTWIPPSSRWKVHSTCICLSIGSILTMVIHLGGSVELHTWPGFAHLGGSVELRTSPFFLLCTSPGRGKKRGKCRWGLIFKLTKVITKFHMYNETTTFKECNYIVSHQKYPTGDRMNSDSKKVGHLWLIDENTCGTL